LGKNSFTLFETLISIFLLSIIIVGFSQNSYYDNFDEEYMLLNKIENAFTIKSYDKNFTNSFQNIKIIKNNTQEESISVKIISYEDKKIKLIKYEM